MELLNNISLKPFNTFAIDVKAAFFSRFTDLNTLSELLADKSFQNLPRLILGGGSNILFTRDYEGLVLKNEIKGIVVIDEDDEFYYVKAGAGENWHGFVLWCIARNYAGIENLSLIPGNTGASPLQNIGAYGVELKDVFHELEAVRISDGAVLNFNKTQCRFGYRDSIFKNEYKNSVVITSVTLSMRKKPQINISYGAITQELKRMGVEPDQVTVKAVSDAVINIRRSKLPDPAVLGNAGSFFKNPEIDEANWKLLKQGHPDAVGYPAGAGKIKVAAGWLIEQCGWKGKRVGNTGSHKDQALVLVNYGNASGNEIFDLAMQIKESVMKKFGVVIEPEVNII
jgi:UDP-N-acetylmuramate dehydrogenase